MWYATSTRPRGAGGGFEATDRFDPTLRASDSERSKVADALSKHYGDGRLDAAELEERLGLAMTAKTRGDLLPLLADLPSLDPPAPAPGPSLGYRLRRDIVTPAVVVTFLVTLVCVGVVMLAVGQHFFLPGLLLLLVATLTGKRWRHARAWRLWHDHLHEHQTPHWHGPKGPVLYDPSMGRRRR